MDPTVATVSELAIESDMSDSEKCAINGHVVVASATIATISQFFAPVFLVAARSVLSADPKIMLATNDNAIWPR